MRGRPANLPAPPWRIRHDSEEERVLPNTNVNLMWIGNRALLDPTPNDSISQNQADAINGWTAEGRDEIAPVALDGNYYSFFGSDQFKTTYNQNLLQPASQFTYDDPVTGDPLSGVMIRTFLLADFDITVHDADGTASVVRQSGVLMQMSNGDLFIRPSTSTVNQWDGITSISKVEVVSVSTTSTGVATIGFNASIFETDIVCFTRGTLIDCADGARPVETLRVGDLVRTLDRGLQPVRWIASRRLGAELAAQPRLCPIRIRKGALGPGMPAADLLVSPQHRILVRSGIAQRMFGAAEVLVAAKQLLELEGVEIAQTDSVEYVHFAFDRHEIVTANGAPSESLYPGPQALKSLGRAARDELFAIFPLLQEAQEPPAAARELVSGRQGRKLASRHAMNDRPLVAATMH